MRSFSRNQIFWYLIYQLHCFELVYHFKILYRAQQLCCCALYKILKWSHHSKHRYGYIWFDKNCNLDGFWSNFIYCHNPTLLTICVENPMLNTIKGQSNFKWSGNDWWASQSVNVFITDIGDQSGTALVKGEDNNWKINSMITGCFTNWLNKKSEWVIMFNGLSQTADNKVHVIHMSHI